MVGELMVDSCRVARDTINHQLTLHQLLSSKLIECSGQNAIPECNLHPMQQTMNTHDAAYQAGNVAGGVVAVVLFLVLALKCFSIARRSTTNTKCAAALGIILAGWSTAALGGMLARYFPDFAPVVSILPGFAMLGSLITGTVLAILGLVEYSNAKGRYVQGKVQAILALILVGLVVLLLFGAVFSGIRTAVGRNVVSGTNQAAAGQVLAFEDFNYKFKSPGRPWIQLDAKKFNPASSLVLRRTLPEVYFMVVAEKVGTDVQLDFEQLAEVAQANLNSRASSSRVLKQNPLLRQGLAGVQWEAEARISGFDAAYVHWDCATNGYAYQLICWGQRRDAKGVREEAESLFSRFDLLDSKREAVRDGNVQLSDFVTTNYHYRVRLQGSNWRKWNTLAKDLPSAEFGVLHKKAGALGVVPIFLMGQNPHPEAVKQALLSTMEIAYPNEKLTAEKAISRSFLQGSQFQFSRAGTEMNFSFDLQVLQGFGFAYLVAAWVREGSSDRDQVIADGLSRVEFPSTPGPPVDPQRFNAREKATHGRVFNQMGLFYYNSKQYEKSAGFFKIAFEFERTNDLYLANLVNAFSNASQQRDALDYLEKQPTSLRGKQALRAMEASLHAQLEENEIALTNYAGLFRDGFQNDEHFTEYVKLLSQNRQPEQALEEVELYLKRRDSIVIRLQQANLYKLKKDFTNALVVLKAQREKAPFNFEVLFALAETCHQAGFFPEAIDTCEQIIAKGGDSAYASFLKGRSEFGLKWYRQAKDSFEAALKSAPASKEIKDYLALVSGMLGEGSNTAIKTPIPAVPLPADLPKPLAPPNPAYGKDYGAYYARRIEAISFQKKKECRSTDYLTVKVLDASGVSRFSTVQFLFDPLVEEIFVNELEVRNAAGEKIATGKVADYYVVDDSSSDLASQRKILNIPVTGLQPGFQADLVVTRRDLVPGEDFRFMECNFSKGLPVLQSILFVRGDVGLIQSRSSPKSQSKTLQDGVYWLQENPTVYRWEPLQGALDFLPTVWLNSARATWQSEATNYLQSIRDRLKIDDEQKTLAHKLTQGFKQDGEKIAALARYVQTNYTYKALEFGRHARIPEKFGEIVHHKYGDCKDHSLVLRQLLEAVDIPARLTLVNTRGLIQKELPSLDQFDHMILYLPLYQTGLYLDCTDKSSDVFEPVPLGLGGKQALILDEETSGFGLIPDYPPGSSTISSIRQIQLTNRTDALIQETLTFKGYHAAIERSVLKSMAASARRNFILGQMDIRTGELVDLKIENIEDTVAPLKLDIAYSIKRQFQALEGQIVGRIPTLWERRYLSAEAVDNRQTPFQIMVPLSFQSTIELNVPAGYKTPSSQVFGKSQESPFLICKSTAQEQGQTLKIQFSFTRQSGQFPASQYNSYRGAIEKALNVLEQDISLPLSHKNGHELEQQNH